MEELYINDILIELKSRSVSRTLQVNDIGDVKDRQANYSNSIKIPRTPNNIVAFETLGITGSTTRLPYQTVSVKYVVDGIELVQGGKGVIKKTDGFFNIVIYDGNTSMTDLLGNKELNSLDYSLHNHTLTSTSFLSSLSNTGGYIYGIGKFSSSVNVNLLNIDTINTSFYTHTLFEMIFAQKGWTVSGDIFTDSDYKSRVISMDKGYNQLAADNLVQVYSMNHSGDPVISETFAFPTIKSYLIDSYTAVLDGTLNIDVNGGFILTFGSGANIEVRVNNSPVSSEQITTSVSYNDNVTVQIGDIVTVFVTIASESDGGTETIEFEVNFTTTIFTNDLSININIGDLIGDKRQIDFVKDIMQRFGLLFRKIRNKNEFNFVQIKTLLKDRDNADNWTDKYSDFLGETYKPNYAQLNKFKYIYDTSDSVVTFGDGEMLLDNVNLQQTKTLITSIFKGSENFKGLDVLNHWEINEEGNSEPKEDGLRIFKINNLTDSFNYKYNDSVVNGVEFMGMVPYLNFSIINYQAEVNKFYAEFQALLSDYKKVTVSLNLSVIDIYELDFFKLKYFEQLGGYYYLNRVSNFKKNRLTKVELIKLGKDVIDFGAMEGISSGSSTDEATLGKLAFGSLQGISNGSSTDSGTLRLVSLTSFLMSNVGVIEGSVCAQTGDTTHYHDGASPLPSVNDTVYTDSGGLTQKVGGGLFFKTPLGLYFSLNNSGLVTAVSFCI